MPTKLKRFSAIAGSICALAGAPLLAGGDPIFIDGFNAGDSCLWDIGPSSCLGPGFQIDTPEVIIDPGEEITYCYYFRTPNVDTIGIRRWALTLGSVANDVTLFTTEDAAHLPADRQAPGTLSSTNCGFWDTGATNTFALWAYSTHQAFEELVLPADDGTGLPLAVEIGPDQPAFLQMHFLNPTGSAIANTVRLDAEALELDDVYTRTASYYTYINSLNIPASSIGWPETQTCATPAGTKFWMLTTHTHHRGVQASVKDGAAPLVVTTDWDNPAVATFTGPTFYTFSPSGLTYSCVYNNETVSPIQSGNDPQSDENCAGIGYFFPATRPLLCIDSTGPL